ncbi:MAG: hypothetical protein ABI837_09185 [Acidobacteriota bacterium]
MTAQAPPPSDYYLEIEAHFALRRNTPFILSAKDWALMREWAERGIPLPVVIEAIDQVFESNETSGRRKTISSLSYCKHAVKDLWSERKQMHVGAGEALPEEAPAALLDRLAAQLEEVNPRIAAAVRELGAERSVPKIEERLLELERELMADCIAALPAADVKAVRTEVTRTLGDTSRLDEATRTRTEEANLRRIVRERFSVPRLSLF